LAEHSNSNGNLVKVYFSHYTTTNRLIKMNHECVLICFDKLKKKA